jgi:hypothetical protein
MIGQLTGFEESAAGLFERIMQPLPWGALVRPERVVGSAGGERGQHGFPDRLTGRGQLPIEQSTAVR